MTFLHLLHARSCRSLAHGVALVAVSFGLGACSVAEVSEGFVDTPPGSAALTITGADGTVYEGSMEIQLIEGHPLVLGGISAGSADGKAWAANFALNSIDNIHGDTISLQRKPLEPGVGMVSLEDAAGLQDVDSGELRFTIESGQVTGSAQSQPAIVDATFTGHATVSCWAYSATRPGERIQDPDFTSDFCKAYAGLR